MRHKFKGVLIAMTMMAVLAVGGTAIAGATGGDEDATERPITGTALEQAKTVALNHTRSGRVTDTEVGDEQSYYEVEVTRPDGSEVDVQLDRDFTVVGQEADDKDSGHDN
jgi:uncharacterized membrane protein YkoI